MIRRYYFFRCNLHRGYTGTAVPLPLIDDYVSPLSTHCVARAVQGWSTVICVRTELAMKHRSCAWS